MPFEIRCRITNKTDHNIKIFHKVKLKLTTNFSQDKEHSAKIDQRRIFKRITDYFSYLKTLIFGHSAERQSEFSRKLHYFIMW